MSKPIHPMALFRLSVLGPLASRDKIQRGELTTLINNLANQTYAVPNSNRIKLTPQTIERWYYDWKRDGIDALAPKERADKNTTSLSESIKNALVQFKSENKARSINTLIHLLEQQNIVAKNTLSRATVHRFLKTMQLSKRTVADAPTIERRSFVAEHPGDIWYSDSMHGPTIFTSTGMRKVYLISLMDDASRLLAHSVFCLGETALDVEHVLKQALLKRGIPKKLIVDNGAAYRSNTLQSICARLKTRLIYAPPYQPEWKGKLERFHATLRQQFLTEIDINSIHSLEELNQLLWIWVEQIYHKRPHEGLNGQTPLYVWQQNLLHIQPLGPIAHKLDNIFCHRFKRYVRKDGTVSWAGKFFEVPYELCGNKIILVVDPHIQKPLWVESNDGQKLGDVTPLDAKNNLHRRRQHPTIVTTKHHSAINTVELARQQHIKSTGITNNTEDN